ncbi:putative bifunctional diguanylate cyclase/phosphodiesterase [Lederbergia citrea]|uniref:putative bifunctional diguanylate cyclase/phosphodiesterase n=1 Tax=Lederbergia citrea TaxID=2833581 RepID=UPI001BCA5347|nr:bifunctional diguanylate cyclase/phosphodiesterase [Lederbergia citrea]MBS4177424.1 bifunctional diguanylate cyclase/phosphodiesterase [Lederbergia citrea]
MIKSYEHTYENEHELFRFIEGHNFSSQEFVFIQAIVTNQAVTRLKNLLSLWLPKAIFISTTSPDTKRIKFTFTIFRNINKNIFFHNETMSLEQQNAMAIMLGSTTQQLSKLKVIEKEVERIVYFDTDTGLPNRMKFEEILNESLKIAKTDKKSLIVMFLDLDRFKTINDMVGHNAGDVVLKELANRIFVELPEKAHMGRFGGDKFSIILPAGSGPDHAIAFGNKLMKSVQKPFLFDNHEFFVTASVGISMYPNDGNNNVELMKNADAALNRAKLQGGSTIVFYANEMNKETVQRVELERSLRKALDKGEFFIAYQPIIDTDTGVLSACEALLRWEHPEYGLIPPSVFIPIAEETGLIHPLGNWVLKNACRQINTWRDKGFDDLSVSVNVSAYQFKNKRFTEEVKTALAYSGLEAKYLHLELTESAMLNHTLETIGTMRTLGDLGVNFSIDDFGTGYSSLSYLKHLPIHRLKIDRSFIQQFRKDSPDFAIVNAIMTMGHGLGLNIVAEGVETEEQLDLLTVLGCDYIQGYLIERPMEPSKFEQWYRKSMLKKSEELTKQYK